MRLRTSRGRVYVTCLKRSGGAGACTRIGEWLLRLLVPRRSGAVCVRTHQWQTLVPVLRRLPLGRHLHRTASAGWLGCRRRRGVGNVGSRSGSDTGRREAPVAALAGQCVAKRHRTFPRCGTAGKCLSGSGPPQSQRCRGSTDAWPTEKTHSGLRRIWSSALTSASP